MRRLLRAWLRKDLLAEYGEGLFHGMDAGRTLAKFNIRKKFYELEADGSSVPNLYTLDEIVKVINDAK